MPQRRPTPIESPPPAREAFAWPPSVDELDAIEVIVLDQPPAKRHKVDVTHWVLTLTSLLAIVAALALQFADWRGMWQTPQEAPALSAALASSLPAAAAAVTAPSTPDLASMPPTASAPAAASPVASRRRATPPPRAVASVAPAFMPVRKPRTRERRAPSAVDIPPLRLPESYVQPRLVSSADTRRTRGKVVLGVQVRANGRVGAVDVLSDDGDRAGDRGDRDLERAAVAAVKQWRYRPAMRDGIPTSARLKVIVKFS